MYVVPLQRTEGRRQLIYRISPHPEPVTGVPLWSHLAIRTLTPELGPTSMLLAMILATDVMTIRGACSVTQRYLATSLGVGEAKISSALKRLHRFDVALVEGQSVAIRLTVGIRQCSPLSRPEV